MNLSKNANVKNLTRNVSKNVSFKTFINVSYTPDTVCKRNNLQPLVMPWGKGFSDELTSPFVSAAANLGVFYVAGGIFYILWFQTCSAPDFCFNAKYQNTTK